MFGGGDNSAQAQQDTTVDPTTMPDPVTVPTDDTPPVGPPPTSGQTDTDVPTEAAELPAVVPPPSTPAPTPAAVSTDDLLDIKQSALQELSPLLGHLDQAPEERFRTTMMMIQASDNSGLLKSAYEAAQQISDEKIRAQALLDVVNEINYFTQHDEAEAEPAA
jgi:hypothetical protein